MSVVKPVIATRVRSMKARVLARLHKAWWGGTAWERVRGAGLFDDAWYRRMYPDVRRTGVDPLWHFATKGSAQGRDPNPMFSTRWYLETYPDIAELGVNPLIHYMEHGAAEGRDPGPRFDTSYYIDTNADVRAANLNPLAHYLASGEREGRRPVPLSRKGTRRTLHAVIVSGEPDTPGHVYRVVRLAGAMRRLGHVVAVRTLAESAWQHSAEVENAAIVVLWRCAYGPEVERIVLCARRVGAIIVFDVDDLMIDPAMGIAEVVDGIRSQGLTEAEAQQWFSKIRRTLDACDASLCTTPALAMHLREAGKPTWVLPNGYDDAVLTKSRLAVRLRRSTPEDGLVRIGYAAGSLTHQRDFSLTAPAVAEVLRAHPSARLVLFRNALQLDEFPVFDDVRQQIEWRDIVPLETLPVELARLDVNLAPLEVGNPFCEAKSALKFFEAALVDVPTIASPTEPFRSTIAHGVNGFLATGETEWLDCLRRLVTEPELRGSIGRAAHASMLWEHGPERRQQMVAAVLDQLLDDGHAAAAAFELDLARATRGCSSTPRTASADVVMCHDHLRPSAVTVVVPVHNYARYLAEALDSVAAQTLDDLDLVVVDDASTDDSLALARDWIGEHAARFNRVVLLSLRRNAGLARARNTGIDAAATVYVLPLDADNALSPNCCAELLDRLNGSSAAFAYPRIRHFGEASDLFPPDHVRGYLPYVAQRLVASNYIDAMALIRRTAWAVAGGYREGLHGWEDYDLWCRLAERGLHGVQVAADLALYRVHSGSMLHTVTHQGDRLRQVHEAITREHPWLRLEHSALGESALPATGSIPRPVAYVREPAKPAAAERTDGSVSEQSARVSVMGEMPEGRSSSASSLPGSSFPAQCAPGELSKRGRELLPLLRCPITREPLEEAPDGGLRSIKTGRRWPVIAGRPVLFPGLQTAAVEAPDHVGNPLPERARDLLAHTPGRVLHLSGGGTSIGDERAIELDAAVFGPTDLVADAHVLPLADSTFDLVIAMNAFEHYRDPYAAAAEIRRVLKPGGLLFVHTAFLQPLHEAPHHYFNCTRYGLEQWFGAFDAVDVTVSDNFHPGFALAWLAADAEEALSCESPEAARIFGATTIGAFADFWRDPSARHNAPAWQALATLRNTSRERIAAGFEYVGRVPEE